MSGECNHCGGEHVEHGCKHEPVDDVIQRVNDVIADWCADQEEVPCQVWEDFDRLLRLARLGAAVEAMPKGWVLEREDWCEAAWNCHYYQQGETDLKSTPLEALDAMRKIVDRLTKETK